MDYLPNHSVNQHKDYWLQALPILNYNQMAGTTSKERFLVSKLTCYPNVKTLAVEEFNVHQDPFSCTRVFSGIRIQTQDSKGEKMPAINSWHDHI
ncbi:hypothetical protein TNCV_5105781 [Trichonephila clavipes]|nr:hypothetical protein TNCV_5105781 [Trichonephila clavipes]